MTMSDISTFKKRINEARANKKRLELIANDLSTAYPEDSYASMMHQDLMNRIEEL